MYISVKKGLETAAGLVLTGLNIGQVMKVLLILSVSQIFVNKTWFLHLVPKLEMSLEEGKIIQVGLQTG